MRMCRRCGQRHDGNRSICQDCMKKWLVQRKANIVQLENELGTLTPQNHAEMVRRLKNLEREQRGLKATRPPHAPRSLIPSPATADEIWDRGTLILYVTIVSNSPVLEKKLAEGGKIIHRKGYEAGFQQGWATRDREIQTFGLDRGLLRLDQADVETLIKVMDCADWADQNRLEDLRTKLKTMKKSFK